jgi:hypothetical protein
MIDRDTVHYRLVCMALQLMGGTLDTRLSAIDKYTDILMHDIKKQTKGENNEKVS